MHVTCPQLLSLTGSRWVFKVKKDAEGNVERHKSCVVAQGFSQRPGINFHEVFAPTMQWGSIRAILALAALEDAEIESVDVSNAYLNGVLPSERGCLHVTAKRV